jgi:hypothetical protein
MGDIILLVFEGERVENEIFRSLEKHFFAGTAGNTIIKASFGGEIFQLYKQVRDDEFLDIVELLKERPGSGIEDISRDKVSAVHLFFDHDAHAHLNYSELQSDEYNNYLNELFAIFNDEAEFGKLWISYPMVEALKHCRKDPNECFRDSLLYIADNIHYKEFVHQNSDFQDIRRFTLEDWHYLSAINIQRAYCLANNEYKAVSNYTEIEKWFDGNHDIRRLVHNSQYQKFIKDKAMVVALSSFPLFLLDYYGKKFFDNIGFDVLKTCNFFCYRENEQKQGTHSIR